MKECPRVEQTLRCPRYSTACLYTAAVVSPSRYLIGDAARGFFVPAVEQGTPKKNSRENCQLAYSVLRIYARKKFLYVDKTEYLSRLVNNGGKF